MTHASLPDWRVQLLWGITTPPYLGLLSAVVWLGLPLKWYCPCGLAFTTVIPLYTAAILFGAGAEALYVVVTNGIVPLAYFPAEAEPPLAVGWARALSARARAVGKSRERGGW